MTALLSEFVTYFITFIVMLVCAFLGILGGKKLRQNKNKKNGEE